MPSQAVWSKNNNNNNNKSNKEGTLKDLKLTKERSDRTYNIMIKDLD